jgi:uncharacterized membrane protein YdbT with pleckstrin-like domain
MLKTGHAKVIVYKRSYRSYLENYIMAGLVIFLLFLLWPFLNINFYLTPTTPQQLLETMVLLAFTCFVVFLFEEPSIEGMRRKYFITNHEVMKIEGLINKSKTTIPYQSVANVKISKNILGRLLNYGTLHIACVGKEGNDIVMKGLKDPDEIYNIIKNKISLMRETIIRKEKRKPGAIGELSEEEKQEARELEKQFEEEE